MVGWGDNLSGQLATGGGGVIPVPVQTNDLTAGVSAIATSALHNLALLGGQDVQAGDAGDVVAWGANFAGEVGDGTTSNRATPVPVFVGAGCPAQAPASCTPIAAGGAHSLALRPHGTVFAWGANNFGQLGNGTNLGHSRPQLIPGLTNVVGIAAGYAHSLALRGDGTVWAWGSNTNLQLGFGSPGKAPNEVPTQVPGLAGVVAVAAGAAHSLALKSDGTVVAWGNDDFGQLGIGSNPSSFAPPTAVTNLTGVVAIAAGGVHSLALKSDGSVVAWGANRNGQLGLGTAGGGGRDVPTPTLLTGGITAIAAGSAQSLALRSDGTALAWGGNLFGEQGNGTVQGASGQPNGTPTPVSGVQNVQAIAAGGGHNLVVQARPGPDAPPTPPLPSPPPALSVGNAVASSSAAPPTNSAVTPADQPSRVDPELAVDPSRPGHLAIAHSEVSPGFTPSCWLALSSDGGLTWRDRILIGPGGDLPFPTSVTDPGKVFNSCDGQSVAYGPDGTLYYLFAPLDNFGNPNDFITASTDGGQTFSPPRQLDLDAKPQSAPTGSDRDYLSNDGRAVAVDQSTGDVYVEFSRFAGKGDRCCSPLRVVRCTAAQIAGSGALNCATSQATPDFVSTGRLRKQMLVKSDGTVVLAYANDIERNADNARTTTGYVTVEVVSSTDHGQTWSSPTVADEFPEVCPIFFRSCESGNNSLYAVSLAVGGPAASGVFVGVSTFRQDLTRNMVVVASSLDGATSWDSRTAVGVQSGKESDEQFVAQLSSSPASVDVSYDDVTPSGVVDVFVVSSPDGLTFSSPASRVSDTSFQRAALAGFQGLSRTTVVDANGRVAVAWVDSRRGTVNQPRSDIFFAQAGP